MRVSFSISNRIRWNPESQRNIAQLQAVVIHPRASRMAVYNARTPCWVTAGRRKQARILVITLKPDLGVDARNITTSKFPPQIQHFILRYSLHMTRMIADRNVFPDKGVVGLESKAPLGLMRH